MFTRSAAVLLFSASSVGSGSLAHHDSPQSSAASPPQSPLPSPVTRFMSAPFRFLGYPLGGHGGAGEGGAGAFVDASEDALGAGAAGQRNDEYLSTWHIWEGSS
eukprot:Rhum_TRINITY_DN14385_c6_g1::Rhum_TRINITY_DN14385_c6_g1_i1::g.86073::m.86073